MSWLRTSVTSILTCPIAILLELNEAFRKWHAGGEDALTGLNQPRKDWIKLLDDRKEFDKAIASEKIPAHLVEIIWNAFQSTRSKLDAMEKDGTLREKFAELLKTPTLEEFKDACRNAKGGKAGSMSGLTYSIVNSWSDRVIATAYYCIVGLKKAGVHPSHWMWKWLAPMPKIEGDITVKDLRPLTLTEVTRQIWTSITVKKIWNFLEKNKLLHPAQHGYRRRRGTGSQTAQLIDVFEECLESNTDLGLSSWDTVRAFDSLSRQMAKMSLYRMGVPKEICEDIIDIDQGGFTFVRCPQARRV